MLKPFIVLLFLPQLSQRLGMCQQALQLALTAASMRFPGVSPTDPIEFLPDAIARAHDIIFVCVASPFPPPFPQQRCNTSV
jgi:hypothetical protein